MVATIAALMAIIMGGTMAALAAEYIWAHIMREWIGEARSFATEKPSAPPAALRPHCQSCCKPLPRILLLPILGAALARGPCRHCGQALGPQWLWAAPLYALMAATAIWRLDGGAQLLAALVLAWMLLCLGLVDWRRRLLPDLLSLPLLWLGLAVNSAGLFTDLQSAVWGAICGYGALWLLGSVHRLASGREGMGHGDFKLVAALGAWLGWQLLPLVLVLASCSGIMAALLRMGGRREPLAFGPHLALGGWVGLLGGEAMLARLPL